MLASDTNTFTFRDPALVEPGIDPVAAEIRDIILAKAADGEPTTEDDLAHLTIAEVKAHFPAGRAAAHAMLVRQVDDDRGFETRTQALARAVTATLREMSESPLIVLALRRVGFSEKEILDLWPDLIPATADAWQRLMVKAH